MSSSTSSLHFLSLSTPNSHSLSTPPKHSSCLSLSSPSSFSKKSISISTSSSSAHPAVRPSRFVGKVFVSSDVDQDEDVSDTEDRRSFSEDLKLFVGNLPFHVDSAALAELFDQAGNVEMVEVIYDKLSGRSRGFGFVTMSSVQEVEAAVRQFNGYELEGRTIRVNSGPPPPRREESSFRGGPRGGGGGASFDNTNRLYVGNLAYGVDNLALETLFREQGKVLEAKVVYDRESGRSRGFGFVTYSSADEVNNAIDSLDGVDLNGRAIRVTVAESKPRRQF